MTETLVRHEFVAPDGRELLFYFYETPTVRSLIREIFSDNYRVLASRMEFREGDLVVDLGANEGVFSIMMAKVFPQVRILAVEPVPRTFHQMLRNLGLNGVRNVRTSPWAVGKARGRKEIFVSKDYSGGSSTLCDFNPDHHVKALIEVHTLDELFEKYGVERCRLLKADIEGMEHGMFENTKVLPMCDKVVAEIHENERLRKRGYSVEGTVARVREQTDLMHYERCRMAE